MSIFCWRIIGKSIVSRRFFSQLSRTDCCSRTVNSLGNGSGFCALIEEVETKIRTLSRKIALGLGGFIDLPLTVDGARRAYTDHVLGSDSVSNRERATRISKYLSLVLRHAPGAAGVTLDAEGWVDVEELLAGAARHDFSFTRAELEEVVETSDKQRFALSADGKSIRANQGQ